MNILFSLIYRIPNKFFPKILHFFLFFNKFPKSNFNSRGVLFVNTHDQSGGASKICYSLFKSEVIRGAKLVVGYKKHEDKSVYEIDNKNSFSFKISYALSDFAKRGEWLDIEKIGFLKIKNRLQISNFSIIHLHNLHGGFFSYALLPIFNKINRVIWTLHDEHILTGHCSFTMNCDGWMNGCGNCPDLNVYPAINSDNTKSLLFWKKKWVNKLNPYIVVPSNWLGERVRKSFPNLSDIHLIYNGIDTEVFCPMNKKKVREEYKLPANKFLVLYIAEFSTNNPFKGGETVRKVIESCKNKNICFITIGSKETFFSSNHIELSYVSNENNLARLYAACDVLFYPTKADNLPLVILEAMSCGLPVISSNIGGINEIIDDEVDGFLVNAFHDYQEFQKLIDKLFSLRSSDFFANLSVNARRKIISKFTLTNMIESYKKLYDSLSN
jgi:glycosyltransferase involved in cell wall biosynthesis